MDHAGTVEETKALQVVASAAASAPARLMSGHASPSVTPSSFSPATRRSSGWRWSRPGRRGCSSPSNRVMLAEALEHGLVSSWLGTACRVLSPVAVGAQVGVCGLLIGGILQAAQESLTTDRPARLRSLVLSTRRAVWLLAATAIAAVPVVALVAAAQSGNPASLSQPYEWAATVMQHTIGDTALGVIAPVAIILAAAGLAVLSLTLPLTVDRGLNPSRPSRPACVERHAHAAVPRARGLGLGSKPSGGLCHRNVGRRRDQREPHRGRAYRRSVVRGASSMDERGHDRRPHFVCGCRRRDTGRRVLPAPATARKRGREPNNGTVRWRVALDGCRRDDSRHRGGRRCHRAGGHPPEVHIRNRPGRDAGGSSVRSIVCRASIQRRSRRHDLPQVAESAAWADAPDTYRPRGIGGAVESTTVLRCRRLGDAVLSPKPSTPRTPIGCCEPRRSLSLGEAQMAR